MRSPAALLLVLAAAAPLHAIDLEGAVYGYLAAGTYYVTDDIHVPSGQTLTLAPGVTFLFEEGTFEEYEFDIEGTLSAVGTPSRPITFDVAPGVEEFNYIRIATSSTNMDHCIVRNAGSESMTGDGGLMVDGCSPTIENTVIEDCSWHGLVVDGSSARPTVRNCVMRNNGNDGVDCDGGAGIFLENCRVSDNGEDGICLSSGENLVVGCLVEGNGEDGIDCNGITEYDATIVNCTVGAHPSEGLSDCSGFTMINCVAVDGDGEELADGTVHTFVMDEESFFGFAAPGSGNYRLLPGSPLIECGTRFGQSSGLLPDTDLDGNPRINGIVDIGCYESTSTPPTGEAGEYFSSALVMPRMNRPVIRTRGESFDVWVARLGSFGASDAQVTLVGPGGDRHGLQVISVDHSDVTPGSELAVQLYAPGIERVQTVGVQVPLAVPEGFYDIEVQLAGRTYTSVNAVKVLAEYPFRWGMMHITDTHVGYDEEEYTASQRLKYCAREINFLDPEFVVITGDVHEDLNPGSDFVDSTLYALSLLHVPVLVIPGNHDHYNSGSEYYPYAWMRYYHEVSRSMNTEFVFGGSAFYGLSSQWDLGLTELWRCMGPTDAALSWVEDRLLATSYDGPLFLGMHGPCYDYFSWNASNVSEVRELLDAYGFSLCLAGHTHRWETFLNEGDNYLGRNDFDSDDDWGRDVEFPGYPLHVQTSSLGKEEHLPFPGPAMLPRAGEGRVELDDLLETIEDDQDGLFGDSIAWRWIQMDGSEVEFFTIDGDDDGYRSTENCWILGELSFQVEQMGGGVIRSTVTNGHYEDWYEVRHYVPAVPGQAYSVSGGTFVRQHSDGTVEVAVDYVGGGSGSVVTLTPETGVGQGPGTGELALGEPFPNPSTGSFTLGLEVPEGGARLRAEVFDISGRVVDVLVDGVLDGGAHTLVWSGLGEEGEPARPGIYYCRMTAPGFDRVRRMVLLP